MGQPLWSMENTYQNHSLNSVMNTSVFADALGMHRTTGKIKSLTIWDLAIQSDHYTPIAVDSPSLPHVLYSVSFEEGNQNVEILTGNKILHRNK